MKLYQRLINSINTTIDDDNARMEFQFRWVLKFLVLFITIFFAINLIDGNYRMAIVLVILGISYFADYWIIYFKKALGVKIVIILMNVKTFLLYMGVLVHGTSDGFAAVWGLVAPSVAILLTGRKFGSITSGLLFAEIVFFFWTPLGKSMLMYDYNTIFSQRLPIVYIFFYLISFFFDTLRAKSVDALRESRSKLNTVYEEYHTTLDNKIQEAKRTRHDIRHHAVIIDSLLNENKIEEAKAFVKSYYDEIPFEESLSYCQHYTTNAFLVYFVQRSKGLHIPMDIDVNYPKEIPINNNDITNVMGNLLENALDANKQGIASGNFTPGITVRGSYADNLFVLVVENPTNHSMVYDDKHRLVSTKHEGLGIGTESVKLMVDKYNGVYTSELVDNKFIAKVAINI